MSVFHFAPSFDLRRDKPALGEYSGERGGHYSQAVPYTAVQGTGLIQRGRSHLDLSKRLSSTLFQAILRLTRVWIVIAALISLANLPSRTEPKNRIRAGRAIVGGRRSGEVGARYVSVLLATPPTIILPVTHNSPSGTTSKHRGYMYDWGGQAPQGASRAPREGSRGENQHEKFHAKTSTSDGP